MLISKVVGGYTGATEIRPYTVSRDAIEVAQMKSAVIQDNKLYSSIVRNEKSFGANMINLFLKRPQEFAHLKMAKESGTIKNPTFKALEREHRLVKKIGDIYFDKYKNSHKLREKLILDGRISLDKVVPKMTSKLKKFIKYKF